MVRLRKKVNISWDISGWWSKYAEQKELFQKFFLENWHLRFMHWVIISNFLGYNLSKFLVWEPKIFQYLYRQNIRPFLMPDQVYLSILLSIFFPRPRDQEKNISFPNNQIWAHKFKVLFFLISETSYVYWPFNAFKLRFSLVDLISSFQVDSSSLRRNFNPIYLIYIFISIFYILYLNASDSHLPCLSIIILHVKRKIFFMFQLYHILQCLRKFFN